MTCGQKSRISPNTHLIFNGLSPNTTYKCCVTAVYTVIHSNESQEICEHGTTNSNQPTATFADAVALGVVLSLIVVIAVTVCVITKLVVKRFRLCVKRLRCVLSMYARQLLCALKNISYVSDYMMCMHQCQLINVIKGIGYHVVVQVVLRFLISV